MRKIAAFLFILSMMISLSAAGAYAAEQPREYTVEENTAENKTTYPYVVHTDSATWYLSKDDIDLMGEDAFFEGLREILQYQDADFADARAALAGLIQEEVRRMKTVFGCSIKVLVLLPLITFPYTQPSLTRIQSGMAVSISSVTTLSKTILSDLGIQRLPQICWNL